MTLAIALMASSFASSHREAPVISQDPSVDLTDFYLFESPAASSQVVMIMNVNPLQDPGGGPNFSKFDDTARYEFKCDNEGDGLEDVTYRFEFDTTYQFPGEFLYNLGDISNSANLNHRQTYTLKKIADGVTTTLIGTGNPGDVAPANVGVASDPTGGYTPESTTPGSITTAYIKSSPNWKAYAGPRQESFYVDLEQTFDLLALGGTGTQTNTLLGKNTSSIVLQVSKRQLTKDGQSPDPALGNEVIACWSTTSRPRTRTYDAVDGVPNDSGLHTQTARLGMPLVNEVAIAVQDKDKFNASKPVDDIQFLSYVTDPILPIYMEAILGVPNPGSYDAGLGIGGREDLIFVFLTGIPGLNMPSGFSLGGAIPGEVGKNFAAFEALRLNMTAASGFPNGRLVGDDVTDVALSAMAGLLIDGTFVPDGVGSAGLSVLTEFPFIGDPWAGDDHPAQFHDVP